MTVTVDMYLTLAIAVGALYLGRRIRGRVHFFERFCFPAPVIGGGIVSVLLCALHVTGLLHVTFDETLRDVSMVLFFTSVGYGMNIRILKSGGVVLLRLLLVILLIAFAQNGIAVGLSHVLRLDPRIGLCTGSIPMLGGHGTSAAFGPLLEQKGLADATTLCLAAATFGLMAGSLIGGPIGNSLIVRKKLAEIVRPPEKIPAPEMEKEKGTKKERAFALAPAACHLVIAAGIGSVVSGLITRTGLVFPPYIGGLLVGGVISNVGEYTGRYRVCREEVQRIGDVMLDFFLGIALITLKLWVLADLAVPLLILLAVQVLFMILFARFAAFHLLGGNYDAAVLTAGVCGFGMGATPNAMANLQAVCDRRPSSRIAFLLIPIAGGLFLDLINSFTILLFMNLFA